MRTLLVLAGTSAEAANFAREFGIPLKQIHYVSGPEVCRGLKHPVYVVVGSFWEREDARELWELLQLGCEYPLPLPKKLTKYQPQTPITTGQTPIIPPPPPPSKPEPVKPKRFKRINDR